jgi:class 3 adenylate cyclase/pimeloyl-ACP methyl ester carboxylesterase
MIHAPPTRYARSGDARIAYQVLGAGPDLIFVGGPVSHLDLQWEEPATVRGLEQFASFCRLIRFDRRGTGLSDPVERPPTLEQQMDDLQAVMDDIGLERAALFGATDVGLCAMYAATHPERVTALILTGISTEALSEEMRANFLDVVENHWGEGMLMPIFAPSQVGNKQFEEWWIRYERGSVSPSMARKIIDLQMRTDLSGVLPAIRVPTLVLHRTEDKLVPVEEGRAAAALIPGARFVEVPGVDAYGWISPPDFIGNDIVEEFLTGERPHREPQRALATVLFTDIVGSTQRLAELGDQRWRALLDRHDALLCDEIERWRGRVVKTVGDGFVATFDGPARGVRCAEAITECVKPLGIEVRTGLHTGECEMLDDDVGGIAVHIGARVGALAEAGEVLVTSTVKELVVGSDLEFVECGPRELRGVPGEWRLYRLLA